MSLKVMALVWNAPIQPPAKKLVMLWFADKCRDDGTGVFAFMRTIAGAVDLSHSSAQRYVGRLVHEGYVAPVLHRRGGAPGTVTHYRVNVAKLRGFPLRRGAAEHIGAVNADPGPSRASHDPRTSTHGPHARREQAATMLQTGSIAAALNVPTHQLSVSDTRLNTEKTIAKIEEQLRAKGFTGIRRDKLAQIVHLGGSADELLNAIEEAATKDDPVTYAAAMVLNKLRRPGAERSQWDASRSSIEREGERLGLGRWDERAWVFEGGPSFQQYTRRVAAARESEPADSA